MKTANSTDGLGIKAGGVGKKQKNAAVSHARHCGEEFKIAR